LANKKISALTNATTPLDGTEVLPIVQSGATVKATVANLTAGRPVTASAVNIVAGTSATLGVTVSPVGWPLSHRLVTVLSGNNSMWSVNWNGTVRDDAGYSCSYILQDTSSIYFAVGTTSPVVVFKLDTAATFTGINLVQGTAAKGINFTANTPAAGMTSQLLNWYEEGNWTPTAGAGLTVIGTFSSTGTYTRVGRQVTITGSLNGTTSVATAGGGVAICAGIPFAAGSTSIGIAAGVWTAPIGAVIISTTLYSATAIAATGTILFSVTYQV